VTMADPKAEVGNPEALELSAAAAAELFRENNRALVGYLTARLRTEQEAKGVAQEAYVRLLQLQEPGTPSLFHAYLFKIATNLAIDRLRRRNVRRRIEQSAEFDELTPASNCRRSCVSVVGARADRDAAALSGGASGKVPLGIPDASLGGTDPT
jgi:DNA-directed RNA polymerase specialized sigma24 family protein